MFWPMILVDDDIGVRDTGSSPLEALQPPKSATVVRKSTISGGPPNLRKFTYTYNRRKFPSPVQPEKVQPPHTT